MGKRIVDPRVLLTGTIQSVIPHPSGDLTMIITTTHKNRGVVKHTTFHVEVWRDEEGNGPGHLYIEEAHTSKGKVTP
jgi:hypothetical protein